MSEYIRVLRRLHESEQHTAPRPVAERAPAVDDSARRSTTAGAQPVRLTAPADSSPYKQLYDNLRLSGAQGNTRRIVLASVSGREPVESVVTGLAAHIAGLGFRVLLAELALIAGRPILRQQRDASLASIAELGLHFEDDLMPLDLGSSTAQEAVTTWLSSAGRVADAILIQGAALTDSIDAALLARACDGLVLVAHAGATDRRDLRQAAERARAAGCTVLGTVLTGTTTRLPSWLRRLIERSGRRPSGTDPEELES